MSLTEDGIITSRRSVVQFVIFVGAPIVGIDYSSNQE